MSIGKKDLSIALNKQNSSLNQLEINLRHTSVISIYYDLSESKHSSRSYKKWTANFLKSVTSPLILYTDEPTFANLKPHFVSLDINATIYIGQSHWDFFKLIEKWRHRFYVEKYMTYQFQQDPENYIHSPDLYAIWNSKIFLTNKSAHENPYNSNFFIYNDVGAWRLGEIANWPDSDFCQILSQKIGDKVLFSQVNEYSMANADLIEGGFFAGTHSAIQNLTLEFYRLHDEWMDGKKFIGKDQTLMNELTFKLIPRRIIRLKAWELKCEKNYNKWFIYQIYLASSEYFKCENDKFFYLE
ncbi:hypothetical protein BpHYR1_042651 [Brachionus plicatilis]|uniref:Uncharacterized protein n=1 Tax=Brachionus plicatilis TaxID=10195 RepID=A0A3M7Q9M1_BRAPC|nr:hypothetical protein BpHYR1_042651 [Brachionus plicatilis]